MATPQGFSAAGMMFGGFFFQAPRKQPDASPTVLPRKVQRPNP